MRFWHDDERQRLLLPLTLAVAIPTGVLSFFVTFQMGSLGAWLLSPLLIVAPQVLLMGLVERHIRRKLQQRIEAGELGVEDSLAMVPLAPSGAPWVTQRGVAVACLVLSLLSVAVFAESLLLAVIVICGLLLWLVAPPVMRSVLRRLDQARPPALHEGEKRD